MNKVTFEDISRDSIEVKLNGYTYGAIIKNHMTNEWDYKPLYDTSVYISSLDRESILLAVEANLTA